MKEKKCMKTILDRYNEIKDLPGITGGIDKLIIECFRYKIFKENPSERFKKDFKDRYEYPYPEYVCDITRKLARNLRIRTKYCRTQEMLALKKSQQRAKRGFSDIDVWSIDAWFLEVMPQMLKAFKEHQDGFPSRFLNSTNQTDEEEKALGEKYGWDDDPGHADPVLGIVDEVQIGQKVLNLLALVEGKSAVNPIGNPVAPQCRFDGITLGMGTVKHAEVPIIQIPIGAFPRKDGAGNVSPFLMLVVQLSVADFAPIAFV